MRGYETDDNPLASTASSQLSITTQLNKAIAAMRHIDDVFQWLAQVIVPTFDIQVTQWWALRATRTNQYTLLLRSMICQDVSIPKLILANDRVASMVERLSNSPYSFLQASVDRLCIPYQATLFTRYGLHYCAWHTLNYPALLLPVQQTASDQDIPTPLMATLLLLTREGTSEDVFTAINRVLDQAISIASAYGLLPPLAPHTQVPQSLPATFAAPQTSQPLITDPGTQQTPQPQSLLTPRPASGSTPRPTQLGLSQLTPRPLEQVLPTNVSGILTSNPVIADKQARRLYEAIDGQRTLEEIRFKINMDAQHMYRAVQFLLMQRRIQLHEPNGQLVDSTQFLEDS